MMTKLLKLVMIKRKFLTAAVGNTDLSQTERELKGKRTIFFVEQDEQEGRRAISLKNTIKRCQPKILYLAKMSPEK